MDRMVMDAASCLAKMIAVSLYRDIETVTQYEHTAEFDMTYNDEKFIVTVRRSGTELNNHQPLVKAIELEAADKRLKTENMKLIKGNDRYEKLRRINPKDFSDLWLRSLEGDETFDELVDALLVIPYKEWVTP
ncbi:MAG: hypothetical protein ACOYOS_04430 [Syntrophales bacterium]